MRRPPCSQIAEIDDAVLGRVEIELAVVDHARPRDVVSEGFSDNSFTPRAKSMQIENCIFNLRGNPPKTVQIESCTFNPHGNAAENPRRARGSFAPFSE